MYNRITKRTARKRKFRKSIFLTGVSLVVLSSVSFLFLTGYFLYRNFNLSFVSALSATSFDLINANSYSILLIDSEHINDAASEIREVSLVVVDKKTKKFKTYRFNGDLVVNVPGRFGDEKLSKILMLGNLENENGIELLKKTVRGTLGINVDRYIYMDQTIKPLIYTLFLKGEGAGLMNIDTIKKLSSSIKTDLKINELYTTYRYVLSLPSDRFFSRQVEQGDLNNPDSIDTDVQDLTFSFDLATEKKSVAVLNGSDASGIAGFASRVVKNMGGRVVASGNASKTYQNSIMIVDETQSYTAQSLKRFFDIAKIITKNEAKDIYESEIDRADIVLIIGFDIANEF